MEESKIQKTETHHVSERVTPTRLQEYGVGIFPSVPTKSALKKALKKNRITVNGKIASTATYITGNEQIVLNVPKEVIPSKKLIFPLKVLFEDDLMAIIHKPAGILVSGNGFKTIANALVQNLQPSNLKDATRPQPVHRLDYATTGILLIGKTSSSIRALSQLFADKKIEKTYYAITIGKMDSHGTIKSDIDNKKSESKYRVIESVSSDRFKTLNLVELKPLTGRRHQLRKHLFGMNNPILGDKDYGFEDLILKGKGLYLHAYSLSFVHPFTNKAFYIEDELPNRFNKIFG